MIKNGGVCGDTGFSAMTLNEASTKKANGSKSELFDIWAKDDTGNQYFALHMCVLQIIMDYREFEFSIRQSVG